MNINKSEFLELVKAESVARKSTALSVEKEKSRAELENDVEAFLKNGGQVFLEVGDRWLQQHRCVGVAASRFSFWDRYGHCIHGCGDGDQTGEW